MNPSGSSGPQGNGGVETTPNSSAIPDMSENRDGDGSNSTEQPTAAPETGTEPGFGDIAGASALPDMRDNLPTVDESYGEDPSDSSAPQGNSATADNQAAAETDAGSTDPNLDDRPTGSAGNTDADGSEPGTRATGGLDDISAEQEGNGPLTTAEQVAILDRQLEQSTSDFDAMILEEQQRQREIDRASASRSPAQSPETTGPDTAGRNPYEDNVARAGGRSGGGIGGGIGGGAPENPAIYKPPQDIPDSNNDDVVARQLREAAMREPDPLIREKLWNEYRKYTGLEIVDP